MLRWAFSGPLFFILFNFFLWAETILEQGGLEKKISDMIKPEIEAMDLNLWGVEITSANRPVVRIFIDAENGSTIDQCAEVSRHLSLMFEVEDIMDFAYILEVSSPGFDRRFFTPQQMEPYTGRKIEVTTDIPRDGRKRFKGILEKTGVSALTLRLADQDEQVELEYDDIKKAKLIHEF